RNCARPWEKCLPADKKLALIDIPVSMGLSRHSFPNPGRCVPSLVAAPPDPSRGGRTACGKVHFVYTRFFRERNRAMLNWLWKRRRSGTYAQLLRPKARPRAWLALEPLEDRLAPATFAVNSFLQTDAVDLNTGADASGHVTLRSAIEAANHLGGSNTINL